ncbi:MAG: MATE family efflux transporter [bacterium]|nr:MATE family efflux transporter [bacterium]
MNQLDLTEGNIKKLFFKYLLPSISATLVTSIYILVDTIIIGKGIGEQAVAALNIILPLFNMFFGIGLLFGVGGSVLFSVSKGEGNVEKGNHYFSYSLFAMILVVLITIATCFFTYDKLIAFLGSSDVTESYIHSYAPFVIMGAPVFACSSFLQTFVRNDADPNRSMVAVICGGVTNIVFDLLLVFGFHMGMAGAAIASVIGVSLTCIILVSHFFSSKNTLKLSLHGKPLNILYKIIITGFPSFLIEIAGGIVILCFNIQLLKYSSVNGITAYSIISNTALIVTSLSNGVSQAAQPILATNFGAGKLERVRKTFHFTVITAAIISSIFFVISCILPDLFIYMYINPTNEVLSLARTALRIYGIGFLLSAVNTIICNYFQATLKQYYSLLLCLLRSLILTLLFIYTLPVFFGTNGIWITVPIVEILTLGIACYLYWKCHRIKAN